MFKKLLFPVFALLLLAGCQSQNNVISVEPKVKLPIQDLGIRAATITINGVDQRNSQVLADLNRDGKLVQLRPSRDLRFLFQEILEKQMTARGFKISSPADANIQIAINQLNANVQEGSLRHNITVKAEITVLAKVQNGSTQSKTYRTSYNVQGPFGASNEKITTAINTALSDIISEMAQDPSISNFIKQNAQQGF